MKKITNQVLTKTIQVENLYSNQNILSYNDSAYPLTPLDFEFIKNGKPQILNWAHSIFLTSFGYGLSLVQKYFDVKQTISKAEWEALAIGIGISFLIYIVSHFLPSNQKETMDKIQKYFDSAPEKQFFMEKK